MKFNQHLKLSKLMKSINDRIKEIELLLELSIDYNLLNELKQEIEELKIKKIKLGKLTLQLWRKNAGR